MHSSREMISKKAKARYLIIVKGFNQKETSKIVKVSERTMGTWAKKYKWHEPIIERIETYGLNGFMALFYEFIRKNDPNSLATIKDLWNRFLKEHEKEIESIV